MCNNFIDNSSVAKNDVLQLINSKEEITVSVNKQYDEILQSSGKRYLSLSKVAEDLQLDVNALPFSLRVVLENVMGDQTYR